MEIKKRNLYAQLNDEKQENEYDETITQIEENKYHICGDDWYGYYTKDELIEWYFDVTRRIIELLRRK